MGLIHIGDENKVGEWDMAYWLKKCSFWKNDQERPVPFFFFFFLFETGGHRQRQQEIQRPWGGNLPGIF